jgi:NAD(P)-dependent dehydrogenase (short-subunit alcohol dehydrogenase family)
MGVDMTSKTANKPVALVTGASSGMGMAFARALRAFGMTVYAAARHLEQMAASGHSPCVAGHKSMQAKTRCAGGRYVHLLMFVRMWFGDRVFDRMILATMK